MEIYIKKIIFIASLLLSVSVFAKTPNFTCTSAADYHDGFSTTSEFQIPVFDDVSVRTWEHNQIVTTITHESDETNVSKFQLKITQNNNVLLEQDIEIGVLTYESPKISYLLYCRLEN